MLDIKFLREDIDTIINRLNSRGQDYTYLKDVIILDRERRELVKEVESLKMVRNDISKEIGIRKRNNMDSQDLLNQVASKGELISEIDQKIKNIDLEIFKIISVTPNVPHETINVGLNEECNKLLRTVGEIKTNDFEPKTHFDIAEALDILDFERASKISGSRFVVYKGLGAKLERAIASFMLDLHTEEHGYLELIPPLLVNSNAMFGTGQLPKFSEDMFSISNSDLYLIPTAEVPVTNYHMNEILVDADFPIKYTSYTPCFRSEAGSAGRDTRGLIRQHQFNKVELVMLTKPEQSYEMLAELTNNAEEVLKRLKLPYRVVELCTGDIGFSSECTNDIEVWMPGFNTYREISSCSNFGDFQARRANIKYKDNIKDNAKYVHTINGSGLAIGRTFAAIIENYQDSEGNIIIPDVLIPYMGGITKITKK